jgi:hypothetical protein
MEIQSLSIAVPLHGCINACPFCVSRMHGMDYENRIGKYNDLQVRDYKSRMLFARKNGCRRPVPMAQDMLGLYRQNPSQDMIDMIVRLARLGSA